ncbi:MAG: histidine ammonia-lyase [Saprospiraceae bacterium]|nr:histidine ammonia-lyase [Saprospiraceae bacterium]
MSSSATHHIGHERLLPEDAAEIIASGRPLALSVDAANSIIACRRYLEHKLSDGTQVLYGINTGFGALCNIRISEAETEALQANLVMSHACGTGEEVPVEIVRAMLFLKIRNLSFGHSGVRLVLVQRLIDMYNAGVWPVVYQQGSLGASGDLAPLAHLSLPLIGLGEVWYQGRRQPTSEALKTLGWSPLQLESKEGLALLNGTQFSTAYALWALAESVRLFHVANLCAALSVDAFHCLLSPFDQKIQMVRAYEGQIKAAEAVRRWLEGSTIAGQAGAQVQDPYAFRCVPQVHGASWEVISHVRHIVQTEINSVTDNPIIYPDADAVLSGGNFHAQPIALAMDYLAIGISELASIAERRTYQLISGNRGLPPFLTPLAGLHSGLMIPQYTAASIVSQNKQLCTPASVDSIVSSNGQEDHVSMAANAATKAWRVLRNVETVLAIEWMSAAQALHLRRPARSSEAVENIVSRYRERVPPLAEDRVLSNDISATAAFLRTLDFPGFG